MNDNNLVPISSRTPRERSEMGRRGAEKANETKARKRSWKEKLEALAENDKLRQVLGDKNEALIKGMLGEDFDNDEVILIQQYISAMNGDRKAAIFVRDTSGNKPSEKVEIETTDMSVLDEFEKFVYGQETDISDCEGATD